MTRMTLLAATVLAAPALLPGAAHAQPVSGLYIGGAGGANFMQREFNQVYRLNNGPRTTTRGQTSFDTGVTALASLGYGFGNGLRVEVEGDYRHNDIDRSRNFGVLGTRGREEKYGGMVNALFDLDVGSPYVFPYVGAGIGYSWVDRRAYQAVGASSVAVRGVDSSFAYQAIAGLSFPVPPVVGLSVTAEYRYFALTDDRDFGFRSAVAPVGRGRLTVSDNYNHSLMVGLRYAFNVAPPPMETSQRVQTTRIEVAGHTDSSGTARYNAGLSQRRAQNVAAELVRLGVPRAAINVQGFGESRPLVQTAQGVREPQNRRVEIVLR